jgi:tetratricopeptide (TPR) repeat protein
VRWALVALAAVVLAGGAAGWWVWARHAKPGPTPPDVPLAGVERPVAALIEAATEKVREQPRSADAWGFLGKVLLAHEFPAQAADCFAQAEALDALDPHWPCLRGEALVDENPDRALPHLRRAAELCGRQHPPLTTPRLRLAEVLLAQGLLQEAEEQLRTVAGQEPGNPRLRCDLGLLAYQRNELTAADDALGPLTTTPYARQKAAACLAQVYQRLDQPGRAAEYARQLRRFPRDEPWPDDYRAECAELVQTKVARLAKVQALDDPRQLRAAAGMLEEMSRDEAQGDDATKLILATTLARLGRYREAEENLHLVLRLNPENVRGHYVLGLVLFDEAEQALRGRGDRDEALTRFRESAASLRRALELKPDDASALVQLGRALFHLGQHREALAAFRRAALCRPEWAAAHLHLGEALAEDGQREEALRELERAVDCAGPGDDSPRQALDRVRAGKKPSG